MVAVTAHHIYVVCSHLMGAAGLPLLAPVWLLGPLSFQGKGRVSPLGWGPYWPVEGPPELPSLRCSDGGRARGHETPSAWVPR